MKYYKDLLTNSKKSKKQVIFGLAITTFAIAWIVKQLINKEPINTFDWIFFTVFATNGILNSIKGFGYDISRIFGKAFVKVNENYISIKTSAFAPENMALWKDIQDIEYKPTRFRLTKINQPEQRLCMRSLDYQTIQAMKANVEGIAKEKSIPYTLIEQ